MQRNGISIKESTKTASELADFFWQIKHVIPNKNFFAVFCILTNRLSGHRLVEIYGA